MKKSVFLLLLLFTLLFTACANHMGDVNNDGKVSITDYTLIRLHILGLKPLENRNRADMNNDGVIDEQDCIEVREIILNE